MADSEFISLEISPSSGVPIYRQLMEQIRRMVASDLLAPGDPLPSVRQIATQLAVNPMTISKSYSLLEAEGILERQRGKGMIVSHQQPNKLTEPERFNLIKPTVESLVSEAKQLGIEPEQLIDLVKQELK